MTRVGSDGESALSFRGTGRPCATASRWKGLLGRVVQMQFSNPCEPAAVCTSVQAAAEHAFPRSTIHSLQCHCHCHWHTQCHIRAWGAVPGLSCATYLPAATHSDCTRKQNTQHKCICATPLGGKFPASLPSLQSHTHNHRCWPKNQLMSASPQIPIFPVNWFG